MVEIRFVSNNQHKQEEAKTILEPAGIRVVPLTIKVEEIQSEDTDKLVKDKTLKAFERVGRSLFVEQTGLYLKRSLAG